MKKMSEVFNLPLPLGEMDCITDVFIHSDADIDEPCVVMHTAHAINHVDSLADALDKLLDAVTNRSAHDSINNQIIAASIALAAYRGEK